VPWFEFPIDDRRRTGLLYPAIALSGRNGFDWRQPIYFNLAPNYDMTLIPRLMTDRGLQIGTEFRYLTSHGGGVLEAEFLPNDKLTDRKRDEEAAEFTANGYPDYNHRDDNRGMFRFAGSQGLDDTWQVRANLNWISDARYFEDFSNNLLAQTPYALGSSFGLYGAGDTWTASLTADHQQLADYTLRKSILPYDRLPRATFHWDQPLQPWLHAGVDVEAVRFQHAFDDALTSTQYFSQKFDGSRVDVKPWISMPLEGSSWYITPTLAWRYTGYKLNSDLADQLALFRATGGVINTPTTPAQVAALRDDSPSRSVPIGSLDAGLYFDRETSLGGKSYLQTIEPRLFYLRVPYEDQSDLPLFDTRPLTFSWGQLFRDNRYTGADRQTDANQITLALTSRLIRQSDGREKLTASIGQIRYLSDSRVVTYDCTSPGVPGGCESPVEKGKSSWVVDANYAVNDHWELGGSYQWDPKFRRQDLASVHTRYLIGDDGVINLGYRYRRNLLKQADLSFLYPLSPSWSLVGRYYYSFYDNRAQNAKPGLLEGIAGIQWDSCCIAMRIVGRRYIHSRDINAPDRMNNAIEFQFELKGLGSAGPDTESRLRRAILGYYREDLYLVPPSEVDRVSGNDRNGVDTTLPPDLSQ
jgi:LPS-assembly protein